MDGAIPVVPAADPGASYRAAKVQIDAAVSRVLASGWYILGQEVRAFEQEFAAWLGAAHAVGCGNGTDALALALRALNVGPGDTVATVSHTAVATVAAIEMVGAAPLLLDIEPDHYTLDVTELDSVLRGGARVAAVILVHLYGQPVAMDDALAVCARHGVPVIEDCSQAHGARCSGARVGTLARVGAFSLYPTKNLGALGDGGVVTTNDAALAARIASLRQYGWRTHYVSEQVGVNSRLDEIQAAILRAKLPGLDAANARRRAIADAYDAALGAGPIRPPARRAGVEHVFHQYVVRVPRRAEVQAELRAAGVGTGIHYPVPVHLQPAYLGRVALGPAACRASEQAAQEVLSLPVYPELGDAAVERVCAALRALRSTA